MATIQTMSGLGAPEDKPITKQLIDRFNEQAYSPLKTEDYFYPWEEKGSKVETLPAGDFLLSPGIGGSSAEGGDIAISGGCGMALSGVGWVYPQDSYVSYAPSLPGDVSIYAKGINYSVSERFEKVEALERRIKQLEQQVASLHQQLYDTLAFAPPPPIYFDAKQLSQIDYNMMIRTELVESTMEKIDQKLFNLLNVPKEYMEEPKTTAPETRQKIEAVPIGSIRFNEKTEVYETWVEGTNEEPVVFEPSGI